MEPNRKPDARLQPKVEENHLPKTEAPELMDVDAGPSSGSEPFVEPFSRAEFQWPPVEVPSSFRALSVDTTLPRCQSATSHAVLGVNVETGPSARPAAPGPIPIPVESSSDPSTLLFDGSEAALALGTGTLGTPEGTLVTKIQSSNGSAFSLPVGTVPSVLQVSQTVSNGAGTTTTRLSQQNVKLHPVLGIFVPTGRRS